MLELQYHQQIGDDLLLGVLARYSRIVSLTFSFTKIGSINMAGREPRGTTGLQTGDRLYMSRKFTGAVAFQNIFYFTSGHEPASVLSEIFQNPKDPRSGAINCKTI
jgi:hypothetical protein